jgi:hypothetical protein
MNNSGTDQDQDCEYEKKNLDLELVQNNMQTRFFFIEIHTRFTSKT